MLTVLLIVGLLVGAVPAALMIREATRDPVLIELESLELPSFAASHAQDEAFGNRWCVRECRSRSRTWDSQRGVEDTARVFATALSNAGWRRLTAPGCPPDGVDGVGSCWRHDEYVLTLFVRTPTCLGRPGDAPATGPGDAPGGATDPAAPPPTGGGACPAAQTTIKVFNRVSFRGGTG